VVLPPIIRSANNYLQHLVFVTPLLLPAAIAAGSSNGLVGYILEYFLGLYYYYFITITIQFFIFQCAGTSAISLFPVTTGKDDNTRTTKDKGK
jgi:hypothetical protein